MNYKQKTMPLSATEKMTLKDLQKRKSLSIKSSLDTETLSYRQYLRIIDKLVENNTITSWLPIFHPFSGDYKKLVWFFVRTNPRDPKDLQFLQSLGNQILSLEGIAGPYSLSALIQFKSDQEFNKSLSYFDSRFSTPNPIYQNIRYQWLEIIAFYKYKGFVIESDRIYERLDQNLLTKLVTAGYQKSRPPTIEELANTLGTASSTIQKQLKHLEENQTILGYSITINTEYQPQIKVLLQLHIHPSSYSDVIASLKDDQRISLLCKIQKESFNLLAVLYAQSVNDLNTWITDLYENDGILDTLTTFILKNELTTGIYEHFPLL